MKAATRRDSRANYPAEFQSTPPVKAATVAGQVPADYTLFQSTPPVKAATKIHITGHIVLSISIHAAREGGDDIVAVYIHELGLFQSTPPVKAATASTPKGVMATVISIHAAREGGDSAV